MRTSISVLLLSSTRAALPSTAARADSHPLKNEYLAFFRDAVLNKLYNDFPKSIDGSMWPPGDYVCGRHVQTMSGVRRADNVVALVAAAVEDGIEGHFIECAAPLAATCCEPDAAV